MNRAHLYRLIGNAIGDLEEIFLDYDDPELRERIEEPRTKLIEAQRYIEDN